MDNSQREKWNLLKRELARLFFIGVGVFFFILFFQPFPLQTLDYDTRLLYVTGFGFITFLLSFIILALVQLIFPKWFKLTEWESIPSFIINMSLLILMVTAYSFYIRYVGNTKLNLYIVFKIFLVCLLPIIILGILFKNKSLEMIIEVLQKQNKLYLNKIKDIDRNESDEMIEILSENKHENFSVYFRDIVAIKSADNYVKIYCVRDNIVEMKMIRNTLKDLELQLINRSEFIKCHRTSIVNVKYIDKLVKNYSGYSLKISGLKEDIPVSRQYLIIVREAFSNQD